MPASTVHTAAYEPAYARVRLDLSGFPALTNGLQLVRRDLTTGRRALVRGTRRVTVTTPASDAFIFYDYEFIPGHEFTYEYYQFPDVASYPFDAITGGGAGSLGGVVLDVAAVWIKHVTRPYLSRTVRVGTYTPYEHALRGAVHSPVRRAVPVGGGDVRGGRRFQLTLKLAAEDRRELDNLLAVGGIWLFQRPGSDAGLPDSGYVQPSSAKERTRNTPQSGDRWLDLTLDEVGAPDADLAAAAVSWGNVTPAHTDWTALGLVHASWGDVLSTVADPVELVVT